MPCRTLSPARILLFFKGPPLPSSRLVLPVRAFLSLRQRETEVGEDAPVHAALMEKKREPVDVLYIGRLNDVIARQITEERQLAPRLRPKGLSGAHDQEAGAQPRRLELAHRVLGRLGLELTRARNAGDERHVDAERLAPLAIAELAHGLQEGEALNVADGAADLYDAEVLPLQIVLEAILNRVGHMGHDLHRRPEIVPLALASEDAGVNAAGRHAVALARRHTSEALVVAEIQIGLGPVIGDEDLPVLEGVHRPGVNVEIRIKLAQPHRVAAGL